MILIIYIKVIQTNCLYLNIHYSQNLNKKIPSLNTFRSTLVAWGAGVEVDGTFRLMSPKVFFCVQCTDTAGIELQITLDRLF